MSATPSLNIAMIEEAVKSQKSEKVGAKLRRWRQRGRASSSRASCMKSTDTTPRDSDVTVLGLVDKDSYTVCPLHSSSFARITLESIVLKMSWIW